MNSHEIFETPHDCPPKWVFMLTAYLDESGQESRNLMVLAGFLGDSDQWLKCEADWRAGLGKKKHLHMNDLRWSKPKRVKKLLDALGPIPHAAGLQAVFTSAAMSDYDDLVSGTEMERMLRSYILALVGMIQIIAKNIPDNETFKLILESNDQYELNAQSLFKASRGLVTSDGRQKLVSIEFVDKGTTLLTEPADYLAYALIQMHRNPGSIKHTLCTPILLNTRPALARQHQQQPDLVRNLVLKTIKKHPNLMRRRDENKS
jgi:hypothetical protein